MPTDFRFQPDTREWLKLNFPVENDGLFIAFYTHCYAMRGATGDAPARILVAEERTIDSHMATDIRPRQYHLVLQTTKDNSEEPWTGVWRVSTDKNNCTHGNEKLDCDALKQMYETVLQEYHTQGRQTVWK